MDNKDLERFDKFLDQYSKITTGYADRALIILLKEHREDIAPLLAENDPLWFHKAFRQTDVCDNASVDMMIWNLLHAANDFWDELDYFLNGSKAPTGKRYLVEQLRKAEDEISKLKETVASLQRAEVQ